MRALPIMIQGTQSDAGKSLAAAALCRIFAEEGWKTAPFKSQNMALNSFITADGKEIGRAQGLQAEAAGIEADTNMNPILIKPSGESSAQIVVHGKPLKTMKAGEYREDYYETGLHVITEAWKRLESSYERVVIEGAGSPAEINLNDRELVNMKVASITGAPVVLVADIDRGGVFANVVGTLQLLSEEDKERVIGIIINKFRGDITLLQPGLDWLENYTGVPVLGVLPYIEGLALEEEDSLGLGKYSGEREEADIDIAVISLPRMSNYTDIDPFVHEPDCRVRFVKKREEMGEPDIIILPGSKAVMADLAYLKENGFDEVLQSAAGKTRIIGICGGFQMMGESVTDEHHVESEVPSAEGLGLFSSLSTKLTTDKVTVRSSGTLHWKDRNLPVTGYEIHMGISSHSENSWIKKADGGVDGAVKGKTAGTYFHGLFHSDEWRFYFLNDIRKEKGLPPVERKKFQDIRESSFQRLSKVFREHIDLEKIEKKMMDFQKGVQHGKLEKKCCGNTAPE
ncbi:cobyric acid synthase [Alkalicoccus saliphilus]|nr:cobyric acid synthase [Alkalicoccus saliphilus]